MTVHPRIADLGEIANWDVIPFLITERATGRIVTASRGAARLCGCSMAELTSLTVIELGLWDSAASRSDALADKPVSKPELPAMLRTKGGTGIPVAHGWQTVRGQPDGLVAEVIVDMSFASEARSRLERLSRFRAVLSEVHRESLARGLDGSFYHRVLRSAVDTIPGAQMASLLVRADDSTFRFVASVNCDLDTLSSVRFSEDQMDFGPDGNPFLHHDYRHNERLPEPQRNALNSSGPTEDIEVTIVSPIELGGRVEALFNLDNLDSPAAFGDEALSMARDYAQHIGVLLQRFRYEAALEKQANTDQLTGLANRRAFLAFLRGALQEPHGGKTEPVVFYIDLDNFKLVNDSYGHSFGDRFVQAAAERLAQQLPAGSLLSRWGGDEFTAFVPGLTGRRQAEAFAEALLAALRPPYEISGIVLHETVSIGVALASDCGYNAEETLRNADFALYEAKHAGRNTFCVFDAKLRERSRLQTELRQAVAAGALSLHYLPRWSQDGTVVALEALARWQHPERGLLTAREFLPEAARAGLMNQLSLQLLNEACRQAREWLDGGLPVRVAFSLGGSHLASPRLVKDVRAALRRHTLPGHLLELQVTETAAVADQERTLPKLGELRLLGASLLLDDISSGFGNPGLLRRFQPDAIRIDVRFLTGLAEGEGTEASATRDFIHAIIALGTDLGVRVVAHGVETERQDEFLKAAGVTEVQGSLFSGALAPAAARELLAARRSAP